MDRFLERMKGALRRNRGPQKLPPGSFPNPVGNAETLGTITKPPYQADDDDEEDIESLKNYNVPEQTRLRGPSMNPIQSDEITPNRTAYGTPLTPRRDLSNTPTPFRGTSSGFVTDLPTNNSSNFPPNTNTTPDLPSRPGFPFLSQSPNPSSRPGQNPTPVSNNNPQQPFTGFPPGLNSNQPSAPPPPPPPPPPNNPQPPFAGFPPGMNQNQSTLLNPPRQPLGGFPLGMNLNQTQLPATNTSQPPLNQATFPGFPPSNTQMNGPMNPQQGTLAKLSSSFRNQLNNQDDNISRLELDYPIENVLIDANIPQAMAVKINDVVEQDRLGNAYHIHRYTFEPSEPQHLSYNTHHHHHHQRHTGNPSHGGMRHIREIHNDHREPLFDDLSYSTRANKHSRRRHDYYSQTELDEYVEQLLRTPGSTVIEAHNYNDLHQILNQQFLPSQIFPIQPSINPFPSNMDAFSGPVFYYTARALQNDPMRNY